MISSVELERPGLTPILPEWNPGVVLEALSKPPYEPLREASRKYIIYKILFLMALAGRCSELQALGFAPKYIKFTPQDVVVTLYFSPEFIHA